MDQVSPENQVQRRHELQEVDSVVLRMAGEMRVVPRCHPLARDSFTLSPHFCQRPGTFSLRTLLPPPLGPPQRNA